MRLLDTRQKLGRFAPMLHPNLQIVEKIIKLPHLNDRQNSEPILKNRKERWGKLNQTNNIQLPAIPYTQIEIGIYTEVINLAKSLRAQFLCFSSIYNKLSDEAPNNK